MENTTVVVASKATQNSQASHAKRDTREAYLTPKQASATASLSPSQIAAKLAPKEKPSKAGKNLRIRCPLHNENTSSLNISRGNDGGPRLKCFGCNRTSKDFVAAGLIEWSDLGKGNHDFISRPAMPRPQASAPRPKEKAPLIEFESRADYCQKKGNPWEALEAFHIRDAECKIEQDGKWRAVPALAIPDHHGQIRWRILQGSQKFRNPKGDFQESLYGLPGAIKIQKNTGRKITWANGEIGVAVAQYCGIPAITRWGGGEGANLSPGFLQPLLDEGISEIEIILDADNAGRENAPKRAAEFEAVGIKATIRDFGPDATDKFDIADFCARHKENAWEALQSLPAIEMPEIKPEAQQWHDLPEHIKPRQFAAYSQNFIQSILVEMGQFNDAQKWTISRLWAFSNGYPSFDLGMAAFGEMLKAAPPEWRKDDGEINPDKLAAQDKLEQFARRKWKAIEKRQGIAKDKMGDTLYDPAKKYFIRRDIIEKEFHRPDGSKEIKQVGRFTFEFFEEIQAALAGCLHSLPAKGKRAWIEKAGREFARSILPLLAAPIEPQPKPKAEPEPAPAQATEPLDDDIESIQSYINRIQAKLEKLSASERIIPGSPIASDIAAALAGCISLVIPTEAEITPEPPPNGNDTHIYSKEENHSSSEMECQGAGQGADFASDFEGEKSPTPPYKSVGWGAAEIIDSKEDTETQFSNSDFLEEFCEMESILISDEFEASAEVPQDTKVSSSDDDGEWFEPAPAPLHLEFQSEPNDEREAYFDAFDCLGAWLKNPEIKTALLEIRNNPSLNMLAGKKLWQPGAVWSFATDCFLQREGNERRMINLVRELRPIIQAKIGKAVAV